MTGYAILYLMCRGGDARCAMSELEDASGKSRGRQDAKIKRSGRDDSSEKGLDPLCLPVQLDVLGIGNHRGIIPIAVRRGR